MRHMHFNRYTDLLFFKLCTIDREFVTSAKKIVNFNEFSEIKKFVKIRTKIR